MTNPFEDPDGEYLVVVNDECQYSLWPTTMAVPAGWTAVRPPTKRQECLDWIEAHWTDMRPRSLQNAMDNRPPRFAGPEPALTHDGEALKRIS